MDTRKSIIVGVGICLIALSVACGTTAAERDRKGTEAAATAIVFDATVLAFYFTPTPFPTQTLAPGTFYVRSGKAPNAVDIPPEMQLPEPQGWAGRVEDPRLWYPLKAIYALCPWMVPIIDNAASHHFSLISREPTFFKYPTPGVLPTHAPLGVTSGYEIWINPLILDGPIDATMAVLAHELTHTSTFRVQRSQTPTPTHDQDVTECLTRERLATLNEFRVYSAVKHPDGAPYTDAWYAIDSESNEWMQRGDVWGPALRQTYTDSCERTA